MAAARRTRSVSPLAAGNYLKNLVEYEERLIRQADANQMATHVRRLMTLVESKLPTARQ